MTTSTEPNAAFIDGVLADLTARGVTLSIRDGRLAMSPRGAAASLPADLRSALTEHKDEVIAALTIRDAAIVEKIDNHLWSIYWAVRGAVNHAAGDDPQHPPSGSDKRALYALDVGADVLATVDEAARAAERGDDPGAERYRRACRLLSRDGVGLDLAIAGDLAAHARWTAKLGDLGGDTFPHRAAMRLMTLEIKKVRRMVGR